MILPLFGFITGCLVFGIIGLLLLKFIPSFKITAINLILFIAGSLPGAIIVTAVYGWIMANLDGQLPSKISVIASLWGHPLKGTSIEKTPHH